MADQVTRPSRDQSARTDQQPLEIAMDSALSPRDIQTRIRSGESLEEVARDAGVPIERVEVFAGPVLAEREHVAGSAQAAPVRRKGESSSARPLKVVVAERLQQRGIDVDEVRWDAWREPDRRWTLAARYSSGSAEHEGLFSFDPRARFSVANNDEARWLIGEVSPVHGPQPGRQRRDPDTEPTVDLNDELALVRAVQPSTGASPVNLVSPSEMAAAATPTTSTASEESGDGDFAELAGGELTGAELAGAELAEVDGVYDIVPQNSDLDVLYEMLSSFNEDSVNIYAGLSQPVVDELLAADQAPAADEVAQASAESTAVITEPEQDMLLDHPEPEQPESEQLAAQQSEQAPEPEPGVEPDQLEAEQPDKGQSDKGQSDKELQAPKPSPRPRKKSGRASVPSWDEIMFGGPKKS